MMIGAASDESHAHTQAIVVLVTASSELEATKIGQAVVEGGVAACANIVPHLTSLFRWEGKLSKEQEVLILIKSRLDLFQDLAAVIKRVHSYQVPEIIALPIIEGSSEYLKWVIESTVSH
jgi:periplasmic divalent cation tolerance protein